MFEIKRVESDLCDLSEANDAYSQDLLGLLGACWIILGCGHGEVCRSGGVVELCSCQPRYCKVHHEASLRQADDS
jgi:hypothetical protein